MKTKKTNDLKRLTRTSKLAIYGRVFFWVFFTILSIETVVLSASYLIYHNPHITLQQETTLLIIFGCILSVIVSLSIIWAIRLILAVYDKQQNIKTDEEFSLLNDLEVALNHNQLVIYFQPQADLKTGRIIGMEALLRWQHPSKGLIMPSVFIPIAEKAGIIELISEWTLLQSCIYNKALLDKGYDLRVAVNISAVQFKNPYLVEHVARILNITQLPSSNLELEITETAMMDNIEYAIGVMMELRTLGVMLSIDDFGMGYSSLSQLFRLPIHKIKIDKAFVQTLNANDVESNIAYSIIQMGHQLNLLIAVEGIENEVQRKYFTELQCHEGQGYYISPPMPADQLLRFLTDFSSNFST